MNEWSDDCRSPVMLSLCHKHAVSWLSEPAYLVMFVCWWRNYECSGISTGVFIVTAVMWQARSKCAASSTSLHGSKKRLLFVSAFSKPIKSRDGNWHLWTFCRDHMSRSLDVFECWSSTYLICHHMSRSLDVFECWSSTYLICDHMSRSLDVFECSSRCKYSICSCLVITQIYWWVWCQGLVTMSAGNYGRSFATMAAKVHI